MLKIKDLSRNHRGMAAILIVGGIFLWYLHDGNNLAPSTPDTPASNPAEVIGKISLPSSDSDLSPPKVSVTHQILATSQKEHAVATNVTTQEEDVIAFQAVLDGEGTLLTPEEELLTGEVTVSAGESGSFVMKIDNENLLAEAPANPNAAKSLVVVTCSELSEEQRNTFSKDVLSVVVSAVRVPGCERHEFPLR